MDSIRVQHNRRVSVKKLKLDREWLLQIEDDAKHTSKSTMDQLQRLVLKVLTVVLTIS